MALKPVRKPSKAWLLRSVPAHRVRDHDSRFVYLENDRHGVKIPLRNRHGLLNGVLVNPNGRIFEIRFDPARIQKNEFNLVSNDRVIGVLDKYLTHRRIAARFRGKGLATAMFDRAEPHLAAPRREWYVDQQTPRTNREWIILQTNKYDTAGFLLNRGYAITDTHGAGNPATVTAVLKRQRHTGKDFMATTDLEKQLRGTEYDDATHWHRIRVLGRDGKPK
jgi:hypothetical protein